jgi:hypothetical protein
VGGGSAARRGASSPPSALHQPTTTQVHTVHTVQTVQIVQIVETVPTVHTVRVVYTAHTTPMLYPYPHSLTHRARSRNHSRSCGQSYAVSTQCTCRTSPPTAARLYVRRTGKGPGEHGTERLQQLQQLQWEPRLLAPLAITPPALPPPSPNLSPCSVCRRRHPLSASRPTSTQ